MTTQHPKGPLCTRESIRRDLETLGVKRGDTLLVHSSLSKIGWVSGGAETLIHALLDALGDDGTLVMPTHSMNNSEPSEWKNPAVPEEWWQRIRDSMPAYNSKTTRTRAMGTVPETLRSFPGALRSNHPHTSFTAMGPNAEFITEEHSLNCRLGEQSPLARLDEVEARVLLLAVGFNKCTALHLGEYRSERSPPTVPVSFAVLRDGERVWMTTRDMYLGAETLNAIGADFVKDKDPLKALVGAADCLLFSFKDVVEYGRQWRDQHIET